MELGACSGFEMNRRVGNLALGAIFTSIFLVDLVANDNNATASYPFQSGEKLSYRIKWGFLSVGNAVLETHEPEEVNGTRCHKISLTVSTNKFADAFYKVRTSAVSYVEEGFDRTILYRKSQLEGKTNRQVEVRFDYEANLAHYFNHGIAGKALEIPDRVFDPLAIAYLFRLQEAELAKDRKLPTCDGKRVREVEVKVGKKRKTTVPAGKFETHEVSPAMENLRGVFRKSPDGFLRICYSADNRRLPVLMRSKVIVGSFVARLTETRFP